MMAETQMRKLALAKSEKDESERERELLARKVSE